MKLHHYTSEAALEYILGLGVLLPGESMIGAREGDRQHGISPIGEHVGPDVVWLTDLADASQTGVVETPPASKGAVRVTVEVPAADAQPWPTWARSQGIHELWLASIGQGNAPDRWWVVAREIDWSDWIEVTRSPPPYGGARPVLWTPADGIEVRYTREYIIASVQQSAGN